MKDNSSNNKRIAKNTILLYVRMILLLGVSFYTSRIILVGLGFEDYGIYNVVGGIVTMFSFINLALANSTSRFITYALGKGNEDYLKSVFNSSFLVHIIISIVIILLSETIGLWLLFNKMIIPEGRMIASIWVFQFSIISCVASILYTPFNAVIIAHEKMGAFAYMSIMDALLKLAIAYLITISSSDRLILYSFLLLCVSVFDILIYLIYCRRHFLEVRFQKLKNISILKEILKFAGWSMIGNLAYVGYTQGLNILLNMFFGPVVNAARGIAMQIQGAVMGFVTNFQMAVNPQITKSYAQGEYERLHNLIFSSSRFSFFLLYCLVLPISIEVNSILNIWLVDVPNYTGVFVILTLFTMLINTLSNPLGIANNATGEVKKYQIFEGGSLLLIVPIAYLTLKYGGGPVSAFVVQLVIMYSVQILRLFLVCHKLKMSIRIYVENVLKKVILVALLSAIVPLFLFHIFEETLMSGVIIVFVSIVSVLLCSYYIGINDQERLVVKTKIKEVKSKIY